MADVRLLTDIGSGRSIWQKLVPPETIWDLWEVRECFHRNFQRPSLFLTVREKDRLRGFLPLSWLEESGCYGYFPGETWSGKTWIEQNRIPAEDSAVLKTLLSGCPENYHLRYLACRKEEPFRGSVVDEIGYLFRPSRYGFNMDGYFREFSRKSRARIRKELGSIHARGINYRYDRDADFKELVALNRIRFGETSYFSDRRFTDSFRELVGLLRDRGWLRVTTVLIGNRIGAVDIGAVYNQTYTLLAGGTNPDFPGVAKIINLHHMDFACRRRLRTVDFLCGDFAWKKIFHLCPRPLYLLSSVPKNQRASSGADENG